MDLENHIQALEKAVQERANHLRQTKTNEQDIYLHAINDVMQIERYLLSHERAHHLETILRCTFEID